MLARHSIASRTTRLSQTDIRRHRHQRKQATTTGSVAEESSISAKFKLDGPGRGEPGKSRYAQRLRDEQRSAARDDCHCLIVGEPGLYKDDIAKLIHYGSARRRGPAAKVECGKLAAFGQVEVFNEAGTPDGKQNAERSWRLISSLCEDLEGGTLILEHCHLLDDDTLERLRQYVREAPCDRSPEAPTTSTSKDSLESPAGAAPPPPGGVRVIMTSNVALPGVSGGGAPSVRLLKVPPLRVRARDIEAEAGYALRLARQHSGLQQPRGFTAAAVLSLQGYSWPGNLAELQNVVDRAMLHYETDPVEVPESVTEEVLWPDDQGQQRGQRRSLARWNVLRGWPLSRALLRNEWWPDGLMKYVVVPAFAVVNAVLIFGPQSRADNAFLNVFWCWWWPLILLTYPVVGRLWCSFCPFMAYGELVQRWRGGQGARLRKWPREALDKWGGWFLYGLFAGILLWEELWALEDHAVLSSALLLLITAGAVIASALYERRVWCRYLCPIGGMNGMFAKLAVTEVRAKQGVCSSTCSTYGCYKGGPAVPPAGMATAGCPLHSHPAQLVDNRDCVNCMVCLKACPHDSVAVNLRPPGIDLWTTHNASAAEVALMYLLLGAVFTHHLPDIAAAFSLGDAWAHARPGEGPFWEHAVSAAATLAYPAGLAGAAHGLGTLDSSSQQATSIAATRPGRGFVEEAYGYLPLTWLASLAHYLDKGMGEAGRLLPVAARTVGVTSDVEWLPVLVFDGHVIDFCQGVCLGMGCVLSLALERKLARRPWRYIRVQCAGILIVTAQLWWLMV